MLEAGIAGLCQLAVTLVEVLVDVACVRRIGLFAADGPHASQGRLDVFLEQAAQPGHDLEGLAGLVRGPSAFYSIPGSAVP